MADEKKWSEKLSAATRQLRAEVDEIDGFARAFAKVGNDAQEGARGLPHPHPRRPGGAEGGDVGRGRGVGVGRLDRRPAPAREENEHMARPKEMKAAERKKFGRLVREYLARCGAGGWVDPLTEAK